VAWTVRAGGGEVRAAVAQTLVRATMSTGGAVAAEAARSRSLESHGRLDAVTTAQVVANAMADIVAPAARALLERGDAGSTDAAAATAQLTNREALTAVSVVVVPMVDPGLV
jgi:hypothetical protein